MTPLTGRASSGQLTIFIALIFHIWPGTRPRRAQGGRGQLLLKIALMRVSYQPLHSTNGFHQTWYCYRSRRKRREIMHELQMNYRFYRSFVSLEIPSISNFEWLLHKICQRINTFRHVCCIVKSSQFRLADMFWVTKNRRNWGQCQPIRRRQVELKS